jgi:cyclopropane fatty-acyl-phospholipid synthase-like methyltransferase
MNANVINLLESPMVWRASRYWLDKTFGLYRKRISQMRSWGVLAGNPSVLDIGCGIGHYAIITDGRYLGVDLSQKYIGLAKRIHPEPNKEFRCVDVRSVWEERSQFDVVLIVDFLHHLPDEQSIEMLKTGRQLAKKYLVSFEPKLPQTNPVGKWIIAHDRGNHMRSLDSLHGLFDAAGLTRDQSVELNLGPITTQAILCKSEKSSG